MGNNGIRAANEDIRGISICDMIKEYEDEKQRIIKALYESRNCHHKSVHRVIEDLVEVEDKLQGLWKIAEEHHGYDYRVSREFMTVFGNYKYKY